MTFDSFDVFNEKKLVYPKKKLLSFNYNNDTTRTQPKQ